MLVVRTTYCQDQEPGRTAALRLQKAFHIAYRLDEATLANMKKYGVDLDSTTVEPLHELPVPSAPIP